MLTFFIKRPRFAMVIALVITLLGAIALRIIPVEQYPQITPPVVNVSASWPGASSADVAEAIATPLETHLTGADDDVGKVFGLVQSPQPVDGQGLLLAVKHRRRADLARRALHVLLAQGLRHVVGGHVQGVHAVRTQPDAHAVVARAEHLYLPDARQPRQRFPHLGAGIVADEQRRVGVIR